MACNRMAGRNKIYKTYSDGSLPAELLNQDEWT
jgi:hypothetical protein